GSARQGHWRRSAQASREKATPSLRGGRGKPPKDTNGEPGNPAGRPGFPSTRKGEPRWGGGQEQPYPVIPNWTPLSTGGKLSLCYLWNGYNQVGKPQSGGDGLKTWNFPGFSPALSKSRGGGDAHSRRTCQTVVCAFPAC